MKEITLPKSTEQRTRKILVETETLLLRYTSTGCPEGLQSPGMEILISIPGQSVLAWDAIDALKNPLPI